MLLGTSGASILINRLSEKGIVRAGRGYNKKDHINKQKLLILLHLLSDIQITNNFNYEPSVNGFYSRDNLPRIKDAAYVINLDD